MLKVLENPLTNNFLELKKYVFSNDFTWKYEQSTGVDFYSHTFLQRPEYFIVHIFYSNICMSDSVSITTLAPHDNIVFSCPYITLDGPRIATALQ